jgi:cholest-4-en-3-one 26-monooxygenase
MSLDHINLLDLDRWSMEGAPYEWFAQLRKEAPVWRHPSRDGAGPGFWVISGYDEVTALSRCPHALSSDQDNGGVIGLGPGDELQDSQDDIFERTGASTSDLGADAKFLLTLDPPEHTTYRRVVSKGFAPRVIALLRDSIRTLTAELLDANPAGEPFDLVPTVSMPLPMRVISDMLGAPREDHSKLLRWSNEAITGTDPEYRSGDDSMIIAILSLTDYFQTLYDQRSAQPADDIATILLQAEIGGQAMSPVRFKMFLLLLTAAGNETTRTAISRAVLAFAEHPEQFARLCDDPSLIPTATEEVLRWASPVLYFRRNAVAELEIGGQHIEPGDLVSLWYLSANRDDQHFSDPDTFDIGRHPNPHVAFGGGGPHFCLGASLARLEISVFLEELVRRYRAIELAGPVDHLRGNFLHGVKHLPVILHPHT